MKGVSFMNDDLILILKEFHAATKLPLLLLDFRGKPLKTFKLVITPKLPEYFVTQFIDENIKSRIYLSSNDNSKFGVIKIDLKSPMFIVIWINNYTIEKNGYYQDEFPVIGTERLISYTKLLYRLIYHRTIRIESPVLMNDSSINTKSDLSIIDRHRNNIYHNSYFKEILMLNSIEQANLDEFDERLYDFIQSGEFGRLSLASENRNKKDIVITMTSLISRAAIKGGLNEESAYSLSDDCCQKIEKMETIHSVSNLIQEIGFIFIKRMLSVESRVGYLLIYKIQNYIYHHQYDQLNLDDMSENLGYSKAYLMRIFKKYTNKTIIGFSNEKKIQEAKNQLLYSQKKISTISEELGFSNQSYFSKTFQKIEGISPSKFKKHYKM